MQQDGGAHHHGTPEEDQFGTVRQSKSGSRRTTAGAPRPRLASERRSLRSAAATGRAAAGSRDTAARRPGRVWEVWRPAPRDSAPTSASRTPRRRRRCQSIERKSSRRSPLPAAAGARRFALPPYRPAVAGRCRFRRRPCRTKSGCVWSPRPSGQTEPCRWRRGCDPTIAAG